MKMDIEQVGVIPYMTVKGKTKVVLVTARSSGEWILPKGNVEADMSKKDAAALEAYEEAGVLGSIDRDGARTVEIQRRGKSIRLKLYPLCVEEILTEWPESHERKRIVVSPREAAVLLGDDEVAECVRHLTKKKII
jgi:8-oxo-dGTP pyrophosphatase MutT (NUDIX family)